MKSRMFAIIGTAVLILGVMYAGLGWWSHQPRFQAQGLNDGRLAACPDSPNCVCSESQTAHDAKRSVASLSVGAAAGEAAWAGAVEVVREMGGHVQTDTGAYLHATFVSRIFRFVDDLELRADGDRLQVRSASRVGYSDLGVNRKRVEEMRSRLGTDP
jgi:uncharacterized protein (DUF1499 family)